MYRTIFYLSFVVSILLLNLSIFTACNGDAGAQNGEPVIASEFVPAVGFIFDSRKADGSEEFETGSFDIKDFLLEDGNVVARGLLKGATLSPSGTQVTLPIKIIATTCSVLEMEIGPPVGLLDPINVVAHRPLSNLSPQDFCEISEANASGDNDSLVDLLNQEGTPQLAGGCVWYNKIACAGAIAACTITCAFVGPTCFRCLEAIGAFGCLCCVILD